MTIYSLALRIKEITNLQKEYDQTRNKALLGRINDRQVDLNVLVDSIISTYHVSQTAGSEDWYADAEQ